MIESVLRAGNKAVFLADRVVLVDQTSEKLSDLGIRHGVIMADRSFNRSEDVLVCSQQTIEKRGFLDVSDLIIIDEAHTMRRKTFGMVGALSNHCVGLTATPMSKGMGLFFTHSVCAASTQYLVDRGWLVPLKVYICQPTDRQHEKKYGIPIIGDVVLEWVKHTIDHFDGPVKTLAFVPTVAYGTDLARQFNSLGYRFEQVSYRKSREENLKSIQKLRDGIIHGLISVEALVKGLDIEDVQCIISARPYRKSLASHIQQLGRGMRAFPGKEFCLVLDFVQNYLRFAADAEPFWNSGEWHLSMERPDAPQRYSQEPKIPKDRQCLSCGFVLSVGAVICPSCGFAMPEKKPNVPTVAGEMHEYTPLKDRMSQKDLWAAICSYSISKHPVELDRALKLARVQFWKIVGAWPPRSLQLDMSGFYDPEVEHQIIANLRQFIMKKNRQEKKK